MNLAAFITMSSTHWRPLYYLAILKQYCLEENRNFSFCIQGSAETLTATGENRSDSNDMGNF